MSEQSSRNRFMPMRQYKHEDFVDLVSGLDERGLLELLRLETRKVKYYYSRGRIMACGGCRVGVKI